MSAPRALCGEARSLRFCLRSSVPPRLVTVRVGPCDREGGLVEIRAQVLPRGSLGVCAPLTPARGFCLGAVLADLWRLRLSHAQAQPLRLAPEPWELPGGECLFHQEPDGQLPYNRPGRMGFQASHEFIEGKTANTAPSVCQAGSEADPHAGCVSRTAAGRETRVSVASGPLAKCIYCSCRLFAVFNMKQF